MTPKFYKLIWKSFQNDKEWGSFYCDSTFGWRFMQDLDLCKLDDLRRQNYWHKINDLKSHKRGINYLSRLFLYRTETQYSCYTYHNVPFIYVHCDISMVLQWVPGPLHSKGKIRVFLLQEVLFACVVHSVGVSKYGHHTAQAQEVP